MSKKEYLVKYDLVKSKLCDDTIDIGNQINGAVQRLVEKAKEQMRNDDYWRDYRTFNLDFDKINTGEYKEENFEHFRYHFLNSYYNAHPKTYDISTVDIPDLKSLKHHVAIFVEKMKSLADLILVMKRNLVCE